MHLKSALKASVPCTTRLDCSWIRTLERLSHRTALLHCASIELVSHLASGIQLACRKVKAHSNSAKDSGRESINCCIPKGFRGAKARKRVLLPRRLTAGAVGVNLAEVGELVESSLDRVVLDPVLALGTMIKLSGASEVCALVPSQRHIIA